MKIRIAVAALLALAGAVVAAQQAPPPAQEPPPVTFRVEVNYVEVDAIVTDANGNPINDLTAKDFTILEDGRPQAISTFSLVNLPVEQAERPLFAAAPIEPDVQSNTAAEGRIYLLVLDDLHVTFSNTPRVRRALNDFIDRNFGVNDLAAVVFTSGRASDGQDFTNNRRLLKSAVEKFSGRKLRSEVLEIADQLNRPRVDDSQQLNLTDPMERERAQNARTTMDQIEKLAEFMAGVRGRRKALVLVSEGISYNIYDVITNTSANMVIQETSDAIGAATRGNVAIYAIDPRGLDAFAESIELSGTPADANTFSPARAFADTLRLSQESLRVIAAETGGFAAVNRNDFSDAFARLVRENSTYYVLGYYPSNERRDGRFRKLEVRVNRPGAQVRSRRGYIAPRGRAPETPRAGGNAANPMASALNEALGSPIPMTGIPMRVAAAAYKGAAPNASIALSIELGGKDFRFMEKDGVFNDRVEVTITAVDNRGTIKPGDRHTLGMNMKPDTVSRVRDLGFRVVTQTELAPGRYQLRVAAAEEGGPRAGSVLYDLEIPDFYKAPFAMSGVAITSGRSMLMPTVLPKTPLSDFLPAPPIASREFGNDDVLALFTEFYENIGNAPAHGLDFTTTVRAEDGRVVFEDREERSSADVQGKGGGHGYRVNIPLTGFAPGAYVIRVEGKTRANAEAVVGKDVLIRVR